MIRVRHTQPPLGGCVLKHEYFFKFFTTISQPPLGGCVLKLAIVPKITHSHAPAAFRRLCVETANTKITPPTNKPQPPLGGCVLKQGLKRLGVIAEDQPPLGGCVLKPDSRPD